MSHLEKTVAELMDGRENRAVRAFLMRYGHPGLTVGAMQRHMNQSGFSHWPAWAEAGASAQHLTKAGAQDWLRHLFALERLAGAKEQQ
jgi:hypothetical protein